MGISDKMIKELDQYFSSLVSDEGVSSSNYCRIQSSRNFRLHGCEFYMEDEKKNKYHKAFGYKSSDKIEKIKTNSVFSIYSCTKIFVSMLTMKFFEMGIVNLSDEVSDYLPFFKKENFLIITDIGKEFDGNLKVNERIFKDPNPLQLKCSLWFKTRPSLKSLLISHCLNQQSGFGGYWYGIPPIYALLGIANESIPGVLEYPGGYEGLLTANLYTERFGSEWFEYFAGPYVAKNVTYSPAGKCEPKSLQEYVEMVASIGFCNVDPGEGETNGHCYNILAATLEKAWEKKTGKFVRFSELFDMFLVKPLGLNNTGYFVSSLCNDFKERKIPEHFKPFPGDALKCIPRDKDKTNDNSFYHEALAFEQGMTGLYSCACDMANILRLFVSKGKYESFGRIQQYLTEESIDFIINCPYTPVKNYTWFDHVDCYIRKGYWAMGGLRSFEGTKYSSQSVCPYRSLHGKDELYTGSYFMWYGIGDTSWVVLPDLNIFFIVLAQDFSCYSPGSFSTCDDNEDGLFKLYGEAIPLTIIQKFKENM